MEFDLLGWPDDRPTLRLDHRRFSYAGKFVMSNTGKAVVRAEGSDGGDETAVGDGATDEDGTAGGDGATDEDGTADGDGEIVAAVAFDADRTDAATAWLRYVTVRDDRRGEGVGPRLCAYATARLAERGFERVRIAVNNPYAFEALHRVGFAWTGEETGLAELVLARPANRPAPASERESGYQSGLDVYRGREGLSDGEREFLADRASDGPPALLDLADDPGEFGADEVSGK